MAQFQTPKSKDRSELNKQLVCFGLLALLVFLLYLPGLHFPFLRDWDDGNFVMFNPRLAFSLDNLRYYAMEPFQDLYTPLPMYSLMIDKALFGLAPTGFRLHNMLLHFIGCGFLFLIFRRLGVRAWIAFAAAALWAANPQKVESVVWITERKDVLCGAFAFASLYCFLRSAAAGRAPILAGILSALAIFAKPAALPLPGVMIVGLICIYGKRLPVKEYVRLLRFPVAASAAAVAWSAWVTAKTNPGMAETNLFVPLHNLFWYPLTALVPYAQNPIYPQLRSAANAAPPVLAGLLLAAVYVRVSRYFRIPWRRIVCVLLIVAGCTVPVLGLLRYTCFHYCDRYNYLVSAAVWAGLALLLEAVIRRRRSAARPLKLLCAAVGAVFFYQTWCYIPYWENGNTLYACALAQDRLVNIKVLGNTITSAFRSENAGLLKDATGRLSEYYPEYGFPEEMAKNTVLFCEGHIALLQQNFAEALPIFRKLRTIANTKEGQAAFLWPHLTHPLLYRDLALISIIEKQPEQAVAFLDLELERRPEDDVQRYLALAMKAQIQGDRAAQLKAWETVVAMEPDNVRYREFFEKLKSRPRIP